MVWFQEVTMIKMMEHACQRSKDEQSDSKSTWRSETYGEDYRIERKIIKPRLLDHRELDQSEQRLRGTVCSGHVQN